MAALAKTQEELRLQQAQFAEDEKARHAKAEKRVEDARWKPTIKVLSKVENNDQANYFRLESSVEFSLIEVSLCTQGGAKVHSFPLRRLIALGAPWLVYQLARTALTHALLLRMIHRASSSFRA
jgi:hypothetical protein